MRPLLGSRSDPRRSPPLQERPRRGFLDPRGAVDPSGKDPRGGKKDPADPTQKHICALAAPAHGGEGTYAYSLTPSHARACACVMCII